jgi:hypothetical protein
MVTLNIVEKTTDTCSGGAPSNICLNTAYPDKRLSWFSSVHPGKFLDNTCIKLWPYPFKETASVVYWSEFLATDPEVPGSIHALPDFLRTGSTQPREYN